MVILKAKFSVSNMCLWTFISLFWSEEFAPKVFEYIFKSIWVLFSRYSIYVVLFIP